jgi:hypothetical protein
MTIKYLIGLRPSDFNYSRCAPFDCCEDIRLLFRPTRLSGEIRNYHHWLITRFRLNTALYILAKAMPGTIGRTRKRGKRLPTLETVVQGSCCGPKNLAFTQLWRQKGDHFYSIPIKKSCSRALLYWYFD